MLTEATDRDLILSSQCGQTAPYGELVRRYQGSVFNVCYRMWHNWQDAEDMTQETFVRAYHKLATFDTSRPFGPWVRRVAVNVCLNAQARQRVTELPLNDEFEAHDEQPTPEEVQAAGEAAEQIQAALVSLPASYRAAVELRHFQGLSYAEIAETLGVSLNTAKSHLFRGRKLLAKRLKKEDVG